MVTLGGNAGDSGTLGEGAGQSFFGARLQVRVPESPALPPRVTIVANCLHLPKIE